MKDLLEAWFEIHELLFGLGSVTENYIRKQVHTIMNVIYLKYIVKITQEAQIT